MLHHDTPTDKSTNVRSNVIRGSLTLLSRLAPAVAGSLAERLFLTPMPAARPRRESAWAAEAERLTVPSPLGPIPIWIWGNGQRTILLVHGWSGRGLQLGAFAKPLVANGYRVVAYDGPAHGEADGRTSSIPALAAALGTVGRQFGPVEAILSHSLGTVATLYALAQHELRVDRLVAISPSARLDQIGQRFGEMTGFTSAVVDRVRQRLEKRFGFEWERIEPLLLARETAAANVPVPLLVVHDAKDRFIPLREGEVLAEAWPNGRLITTTGLGHHRILRDPGVVQPVVSFLSQPVTDRRSERRAS